MVGDQREIRSDGLANGKLERTAYHGSQDTSMLSRSDAHPVHAVRFGARGSAWSYPSGFNQSPAAPSAPWRCWAAAAVWSGPRAAESRFVPFSEAQRSGKTGAAIPRGESGLCDPRRSQTTTGASVRLTSVAQAPPLLAATASAARVRAATVFRTAEAGRGRPVPARRAYGSGEPFVYSTDRCTWNLGVGS